MTASIGVRRPSHRAGAASTVLAALVLVGALLAGRMLAGLDPLPAAPGGSGEARRTTFEIGDDVPTSFGFVAVEHATAISGLSDQDLQGAHGVPDVVEAGSIDVQVAATITNLSDAVVRYDPSQFELLDADGHPIPLTRAPELPAELQPGAAIDMSLDFVTTTERRPFTVRFVDPASGAALRIGLGAVGCTVESGNGRPLPVTGGCSQPGTDAHHHSGG